MPGLINNNANANAFTDTSANDLPCVSSYSWTQHPTSFTAYAEAPGRRAGELSPQDAADAALAFATEPYRAVPLLAASAPLRDTSSNCAHWAEIGECEANAGAPLCRGARRGRRRLTPPCRRRPQAS